MFDERFATALATEIAARINPQIQRRNGATANRLPSVKDAAAAYIGRTEQALQHLIHKREIVVVRKGRRVHLDRAEVHDPVFRPQAEGFVIEYLAQGRLRPKIDRTFPLSQVVEAHRHLESNQQIGKVVVTVKD